MLQSVTSVTILLLDASSLRWLANSKHLITSQVCDSPQSHQGVQASSKTDTLSRGTFSQFLRQNETNKLALKSHDETLSCVELNKYKYECMIKVTIYKIDQINAFIKVTLTQF